MPAKKSAKKTTKKAPSKKAIAKLPAKKIAKKTTQKIQAARPNPSHDEISKVAFKIYTKRLQLNLPGNSESDWDEAVRSLS